VTEIRTESGQDVVDIRSICHDHNVTTQMEPGSCDPRRKAVVLSRNVRRGVQLDDTAKGRILVRVLVEIYLLFVRYAMSALRSSYTEYLSSTILANQLHLCKLRDCPKFSRPFMKRVCRQRWQSRALTKNNRTPLYCVISRRKERTSKQHDSFTSAGVPSSTMSKLQC